MSDYNTDMENLRPPSKSTTDEAVLQPLQEDRQPKRLQRKKRFSVKFLILSISSCLVLIGISILNSEVRLTIFYPAIAYLVFHVIEKVVEHHEHFLTEKPKK